MTFFLNEPVAPPKIKARNPDIDLAEGFGGGLGAAITVSQLENDANFIGQRTTVKTRAAKGWSVAERLGAEAIEQRARERGVSDGSIRTFTRMMGRKPPNMPEEMEAIVFELAGEAAADQPEAWADLDFSEEAILQEANEQLQAEYHDAQATLEMMPGWQGVAGFLGGMIGMTADVKNIPFLAMGGGGGSIMRVMGREAMINMTAEAAFLPSQFEMADRLEIPDPDVVTQLAIAGAAGGLLGGVVEAGARGVSYFRLRNSVAPIPGMDEFQARAAVDEAEDILTSDTPRPFEQIRQLQEEAQKPYLLENPINPTRPPLIPSEPDWDAAMARAQRGEVAEPGDAVPPAVTTEELPEDDLFAGLTEAVNEAKAADRSAARPLAQFLRDNHKSGGENLQIHPEGMAAEELRARGITPRTMPGLFSENGRKDFDNLVADEMEQAFPGIIEASGTQRGSQYLDRDGFLEVLQRDLDRDSSWLQTRAEVEAREADLEDFLRERDGSPVEDFVAGERADNGFYVDRTEYEFLHSYDADAQIEKDLNAYLHRTGLTFLTKDEYTEILEELRTRGGESEYLIERLAEREIQLAATPQPEDALNDIPFPVDAPAAPENVGRSPGDTGRSEGDTGAEGAGGARAEDAPTARIEQTEAGEQIVAPGIEPVTQRERLEAQQGAALRGGDAPADMGLFDTGARAQTDMFDDPASPEAKPLLDQKTADFRDEIEANGPIEVNIATDDGRVLATDEDVLDYLDEGDDFADMIGLCGTPEA